MTTDRSMRRRGLAAVLAAGLMLAACGGDDDSEDGGDDTAAEDADAEDAGDTASDDGGDTADGGDTTDDGGDDSADDSTDDTADDIGSESTGDAGAAADVDREATLIYASCCVPISFDPHNQIGGGVSGWFSLYDRLTYAGTPEDPEAPGISPMIAESWEYSDDGLVLTMYLRDDVTFNDGSPVNADAVVASLERARAAETSAATVLASVASVDATDDTTVVLTLSEPDGALPANLSGVAGAVMNPAVFDDPSVDLDLAPPAAAGSGPFALESHEPSTRSVLVRADDDYWDPSATYLARIEILAEPDTTTRLNGLQSGDYDLVQLFSRFVPEGVRLAESDDFDNHAIDGRSNSVLFFRREGVLAEPAVREAIALATDRLGIAEGALDNTCTSNDQVWSPGMIGFDPGYENPYPYDPDAARATLAAAGVDGASIEILFPVGATQEVIATALQAALTDIGIEATITGVPPTDLQANFVGGAGDAVLTAIVAAPDPDTVVANQIATYTFAGDDPEFNELMIAGRTELDPEARGEIYGELSDSLIDNTWLVPFCNAQFAWASQNHVINVERMPWNWSALPDVRYLGISAG